MKFLAILAAPIFLIAQPTQTFETASIKPVEQGGSCQSMIEPMTGGGLRVDCVGLKSLITWAYQVQNYQVNGGPGWMETANWNILARGPAVEGAIEYEKMTDDQRKQSSELVRKRLQSLLAERFQLTLRRESREQSVYALTIGKGGAKLKESEDQSKSGMVARGRGRLLCRGGLLDTAMQFLAVDLGRPVINQTGLSKHYDFEIRWTPEGQAGKEGQEGPTVFTAIQELGLKLESTKAPVAMLVIERAEKPSEN
jgi:uncharacterized protein (TIGR03435 family)